MLSEGGSAKHRIEPADCSARLLEVVPSIMRHIRQELRSHAMQGLSVPQFRTLNYIWRRPDASLSSVAEHLGLTPPTVSKMIQKLVEQGIIIRNSASDRRQVRLSLSAAGISVVTQAREETRRQLAENLKTLSQEELNNLLSALGILENVFSKNGTDVNLS